MEIYEKKGKLTDTVQNNSIIKARSKFFIAQALGFIAINQFNEWIQSDFVNGLEFIKVVLCMTYRLEMEPAFAFSVSLHVSYRL